MSTIKATTLSTQSNATVSIDTVVNGTAKAWVNFNGTGTVAVRASFNVSSITDNGVGDYTVNFSTAMPDANIIVVGTCQRPLTNNAAFLTTPFGAGLNSTTTTARVATIANDVSSIDSSVISIAIFR